MIGKNQRKRNKIPPEPAPTERSARTDLALEERELWHREAGEAAKLPGVTVRETERRGIRTTVVNIENEQGSRELKKPVGCYVTLELEELQRRELRAFRRVSQTLAGELAALMRLREGQSILVVGLGNEDVTPDALGPLVLRKLFVTRHLTTEPVPLLPLRPVSALQPGVLGTTGMESFEIVRSVVERTRPDAVIAVDALASRSIERLCATVQLTDTGIIPGSGVGNRRPALTKEELGVPVYAVGAPTVMDAAPLLGSAPSRGTDLIVTPRSIDTGVRRIAGVIGAALNLSLHNQLSSEQIAQFVEDGR